MTAAALELDIDTPEWAEPLLAPARYKGAHGGRGGGKSHFFAERAVECGVADPDFRLVCIREVQRSLRYSAKSLIESKIIDLGVGHLFDVQAREIRRKGGRGVMIFEGMQDHTADSIKSLEAFDVAWCEEAQNLSARSLALLKPTIRKQGSELWFSWNPDKPDDAVDKLLIAEPPAGAIVVQVNYTDNPWFPDVLLDDVRRDLLVDPDAHAHIWLGQYNTRSVAQILNGKWRVDEFTPHASWDGPYHGADFGFSQDPNTLVRCWIAPGKPRRDGSPSTGRLMIEREAYRVGQELDAIAPAWLQVVPNLAAYIIRADSARPETISYLARHGLPKITGVQKWTGSVEDGITHLRQYDEIVIHPSCAHAIQEARLYSYKIDKRSGDVLPEVVDKHNHIWDAVRYALAPLIKQRPTHTRRVVVPSKTYASA